MNDLSQTWRTSSKEAIAKRRAVEMALRIDAEARVIERIHFLNTLQGWSLDKDERGYAVYNNHDGVYELGDRQNRVSIEAVEKYVNGIRILVEPDTGPYSKTWVITHHDTEEAA